MHFEFSNRHWQSCVAWIYNPLSIVNLIMQADCFPEKKSGQAVLANDTFVNNL